MTRLQKRQRGSDSNFGSAMHFFPVAAVAIKVAAPAADAPVEMAA
jgi:hypothetical protein